MFWLNFYDWFLISFGNDVYGVGNDTTLELLDCIDEEGLGEFADLYMTYTGFSIEECVSEFTGVHNV